jgi:hypothetical protein
MGERGKGEKILTLMIMRRPSTQMRRQPAECMLWEETVEYVHGFCSS